MTKQSIPEPFERKMRIDRTLRDNKVVDIELIRQRRIARRECQVYFLGPKGGGPLNGGTPIALAA